MVKRKREITDVERKLKVESVKSEDNQNSPQTNEEQNHESDVDEDFIKELLSTPEG